MMTSRYFTFVLYPECELHCDILVSLKNYNHLYICHDYDEDKKPHIHCFVAFKNARSLDSFSNEIGLPRNAIEVVKSKRAILRYLIHLDNPEKYQYSTSLVKGNMIEDFEKAIASNNSEEEIMRDILESVFAFIGDGKPTYKEVVYFCMQFPKGMTFLKKYSYLLKNILT